MTVLRSGMKSRFCHLVKEFLLYEVPPSLKGYEKVVKFLQQHYSTPAASNPLVGNSETMEDIGKFVYPNIWVDFYWTARKQGPFCSMWLCSIFPVYKLFSWWKFPFVCVWMWPSSTRKWIEWNYFQAWRCLWFSENVWPCSHQNTTIMRDTNFYTNGMKQPLAALSRMKILLLRFTEASNDGDI